MKVLLVSHNFPPHSTAGTETYTAELAERLLARGHAVQVFTTVKDVARAELEVVRRDWHGVPVHELVNNLGYRSFRETWDHPALEPAFERVLAAFRPEVVHFQHLLYLSIGCVSLAQARAPVVFTLHDYWLQCPRFGHRVHADGGVCHTIDPARCGTCLARFKYAQTGLERRVGSLLARVRGTTGLDLAPLARRTVARVRAVRRSEPAHRSPSPAGAPRLPAASAPAARTDEDAVMDARSAEFAELARARAFELRARVVRGVDLFLATSRFLRERMVEEAGLPAERIEHLPLGIDLAAFDVAARVPRTGPLRVAFLGTRTPLKGAHLLLEAWLLLDPGTRAAAELTLAGPDQYEPAYQVRLAELARRAGARLQGRRSRAEVAALLAATDLLVVPSLWYENSPLVILEALAARTPLLVSDQGGMAELVIPGESGFHFRQGDAADLARELARAITEPGRLAGLYTNAPRLASIAEHVDRLETRYRELVQRRGARA